MSSFSRSCEVDWRGSVMEGGGQAKAGLICSGVGVVLGILILILSFSLSQLDWQTYLENTSTN